MAVRDETPIGFDAEPTPWLDPIDDYDSRDGVSPGRVAASVIGGLVAIGLAVGGLWWWQKNGGQPRGELIAAAEGDYRVPAEPEKGRFDDEGNVAVSAAEGEAPTGRVDPSRLPEAPVTPAAARPASARPAAAAATPPRAPAARPGVASIASPRPAAAGASSAAAPSGGAMIQLGAFANDASANRAWTSLKGRFTWLANAQPAITTAQVDGRTVVRLRTSAGNAATARDWCGRLRVAGENCIVLP